MRRRLNLIAIALAAGLAAPALAIVALRARTQTRSRRRAGLKPRVIWGPVPLISIKFWSAGLRARGYESRTLVESVSVINVREDFDLHREDFLGDGRFGALARDYRVFAWALLNADVFMSFMDGGFLRHTHLQRLEGPLLRLAGKKLVASPYGGDIAVPGYLGPTEEALLRDYPVIHEYAEFTRRRVDYVARWADVVVRNYQNGYMPRGDLVWVTQVAIDTEAWRPAGAPGEGDGRGGEVVVLHAPNHRHVKGTPALLDSIEELQAEGLKVRLNLIEGKSNAEVKEAIETADIVADQFIAGYAMFAIEGLAAAKPVLSALSGMPPEVRASGALGESPIVDTTIENLTEELRRLIVDPALRRELGERSREFALSHHSEEAVGRGWEAILRHLWEGKPLPRRLPEDAAAAEPAGARAEAA
jgi:hypothetical protein